MTRRPKSSADGFSLIEALAALALTGMIISALATVTAQWLPNWGRGFVRLQDAEMLAAAVERIAADLAAAEFIAQSDRGQAAAFAGGTSSVTFVRSAIGPNAYPHLEFVRFAESRNNGDFALVRTQAPFFPNAAGSSDASTSFRDPVALAREPVRIRFSYADGGGGVWLSQWKGQDRLPSAVRIEALDPLGRVLPSSTIVQLRIKAAVPQAASDGKSQTSPAAAAPTDAQPRLDPSSVSQSP